MKCVMPTHLGFLTEIEKNMVDGITRIEVNIPKSKILGVELFVSLKIDGTAIRLLLLGDVHLINVWDHHTFLIVQGPASFDGQHEYIGTVRLEGSFPYHVFLERIEITD